MSDTLEYIESYFKNTLRDEERTAFEARCETDKAFANEVAFYIAARQALREELLKQKAGDWKAGSISEEEVAPVISVSKRSLFSRWITYAAAACLLLAASVYLFETNKSPKSFASNYIHDTYDNIGQTMDASHDSLQVGIAAYNNKEYDKALRYFQGVEKRDPANSDAKKYAGLAYLQQKDYSKAIQKFDELANMKGLFSNSGDFLKAVTLMERNKPNDKEEAKRLLQKVVNENESDKKEAEEIIKKF
jgi:tetratricopeptide (TPR) repeat protein